MFDPITLAVGGVLVGGGLLAGRLSRRPVQVQAAPDACSCGHPISLHNRADNVCKGQTRREHYAKNGDRSGWEWMSCGCQHYDGPPPINELLGNDLNQ